MVVVGSLVCTLEPARLMVAIAQASSASASANTIAPSKPAGTVAGTNRKGMSQSSASPARTATAHAIGGRIMTFAVSAAAAMAGLLHIAPRRYEGSESVLRRVHTVGSPELPNAYDDKDGLQADRASWRDTEVLHRGCESVSQRGKIRLVRLGTRELDHLAPFVGFRSDELP